MRVFYEDGIVVQDGIKEIILDPARSTPGSIVSHGHMDHLTEGGVMTPETLEIHAREANEKRGLTKCPVCGERVKRLKNMTVFGGTVTLGFKCPKCGYWSGLRRRVPTRYVFHGRR